MSEKKIKDKFFNPSNEFRAKPFWAWNGELHEDELKRQIDAMKDMGFGGYFMHSRVGLITEYLGDEWFRLINTCADYGNAQGLENWIYDEDRWPSGSAGGIVTRKNSNRMKYIRMNVGTVDENADIVGIFSCRLENENVYDVQKLHGDASCVQNDVVWFEIIERAENSNYNGATYLDTMSRQATEDFLNCTHEKYLRECGERIGSSIKGVFTDEPHRGELLVEVIREGMDFTACIPYTDVLFDCFKNDWGYDLCDKLPALFLRENGEKVSQVKWHYCETIQRLFIENYIKPISEWCKKHQMIYTGHMLHEDSLSAQTLMNGSLMRCYEYMDYPGVDLLGNDNVNYNIVKQVVSVANQCGQQWILSEMYGATGWHMKLEDYKRIGDWQAILGVNLRCPHLSWYTMAGECKRDFPASISFQSGWYKEYKYLEDYYARLAVFMSQGTFVRDVLVINPVESMWCSYYKGWAEWLVTKDEKCLEIEKQYEELAQFLLQNNVEYDYGDEEMLSRLAKIEGDSLIVGNACYKQIIIPNMLTIRSSTLRLLEEFEKAGGKVIVYGDVPQYVDAKPKKVSIGNSNIQSILEDRKLVVEDERILTALRKDKNDKYYIMLLNTDTEQEVFSNFIAPSGNVKQWKPENGTIIGVERSEKILLQPGEMQLLSISAEKSDIAVKDKLPRIMLKENFQYKNNEPNVLVVDKATCYVNGKFISGDILKIDREIREGLELTVRGGEMFQPWYTAKDDLVKYYDFELKYEFDSAISCEAYLATEATGNIQVNGQNISISEEWWIDPCFKKMPIVIKEGRNEVSIQDSYTERQNLEAIYILGEFGVYDGVIEKKPETIVLGDITKQGFPHYSGKLTYTFEQLITEKSVLEFGDMCGAAAIRVNQKILAWQPYIIEVEPCNKVEIELSLTRRNTFGPLHQLPAIDAICSPESYVTTDEKWTDEMVVLPCGLTFSN